MGQGYGCANAGAGSRVIRWNVRGLPECSRLRVKQDSCIFSTSPSFLHHNSILHNISKHESPQIRSDMQWKLSVLSVVNNVITEDFLAKDARPIAAFPESKYLSSWDDYSKWRDIPLHSPVALLLQWLLLMYWAVELVGLRNFSSGKQLYIHHLGPEKEILQVAAFGELRALFPDVQINIDIIGPDVPKHRNDEIIELHMYAECAEDECNCKITAYTGYSSPVILQIRGGYYHDVYRSLQKDSPPHLVIAPNAGIAAYSSWLPTIELINELKVPAIFSDYCEEACLMGSRCIPLSRGNL